MHVDRPHFRRAAHRLEEDPTLRAVFGRDVEGVRPPRYWGPAADVGNRRTTGTCAENAQLPTRQKAARGRESALAGSERTVSRSYCEAGSRITATRLVTWSGLSLIIGTMETKRPSCDLGNARHEALRRETRNGRAPVDRFPTAKAADRKDIRPSELPFPWPNGTDPVTTWGPLGSGEFRDFPRRSLREQQ